MISSDLLEVLGLSDRILVMRGGRIAGEYSRAQATEENVIACASGVGADACPV
jgi:ABC-type sugar transport system ATPase subunit